MRKATGKVVSLVLALALVITSFSATFASAATKTESATKVNAFGDTVTLVNLSDKADKSEDLEAAYAAGQNTFNISDFLLTENTPSLETYDHIKVTDLEITSVSVSGDNIVRVTKDSNGKYIATVRDVKGTGSAKVNVLYTGKTSERGDEEITVRGSKSFTLKLVDAKTPYLKGVSNLQKNPQYSGSDYTTKNDDDKPVVTGTAEFVLPQISADSARMQTEVAQDIQIANEDNKYTDDAYVVSASGTNNYLNVSGTTITYGVANPAVGNIIRLSVYSVKDISEDQDETEFATNKVLAQGTAKVENLVKGNVTSVDLGDGSKATVGMKQNMILSKSKAYVKLEDCYWDVTGGNIDSTSAVSVSGGRVGNITSTGKITVSDGTLGNLDGDGVSMLGGSAAAVDANGGDVLVSGATISSVVAAANVKVEEGKVTGAVNADAVVVEPLNDEVEASVGAVTAGSLTVNGLYGKASAASFFADEAETYDLKLMGSKASIGGIDADYRDLKVSLENFIGTIPAITHANYTGYSETGATLTSVDDDAFDATNATVNGALVIQTIQLDSGAVTFAGNVKVNEVYGGEADMIINAGGLNITEAVATSNTLKIANAADVKAGTVVFTATPDIADIASFVTYGYTLKVTNGTSYDAFSIDGTQFSGLTLNKTSAQIVVGESEVFTASAYPNGTQLPEGAKIEFYLNGDLNYMEGSNIGNNQAEVKALKYDADFDVLNKGTLTAVVLDEYDIQLEEYGEATCEITIIPEPVVTYVSDTTGDVYVNNGESYQFKITSKNGQTPSVVLGSAGVFELVSTVQDGNDYFFKYQAVGAAGAATGVYVNGDAKVATLHVATGYVCDTTTVNVAAGASYQVKITANERPTLAAGSSLYTVEYVTNEGNDYFFRITATNAKAGDVVGFYINGGARAFVATTV